MHNLKMYTTMEGCRAARSLRSSSSSSSGRVNNESSVLYDTENDRVFIEKDEVNPGRVNAMVSASVGQMVQRGCFEL